MNLAYQFGVNGDTLSGRDALEIYDLVSGDPNVACIESDHPIGKKGAFITVEKSNDVNIINGIKYAKLGKAFLDLIENLYDDSALFDFIETASNDEMQEATDYVLKKHKKHLLEDYKWINDFKPFIERSVYGSY